MAVDDDLSNWNKENTPTDEGKEAVQPLVDANAAAAVSQEIQRSDIRQALAEITLECSDDDDDDDDNAAANDDNNEDDESNDDHEIEEDEKVRRPPNSPIYLPSQPADNNSPSLDNNLIRRNEGTNSEGRLEEAVSFRSRRKRPSTREVSGNNEEMTTVEEGGSGTRCREDLDEFVTPPLSTIVGFDLEMKMKKYGSSSSSGNARSEVVLLSKSSIDLDPQSNTGTICEEVESSPH